MVLQVQDSGVGMSEDARRHLFEPFFTTKGVGEGSGLGLPTVYGIVRQSGGHVRVDSAEGQGTTVRLYFPRLTPPPRAAPAGARAPEPAGAVLLLEREPGLRGPVQRVLEGEGFTVLGARDEAEAEAQLREHRGPVLLALADVEEGGEREALASRLAQLRPGLRLMSLRARPPAAAAPAVTAPRDAMAAPQAALSPAFPRGLSLEALPREVRRALGDGAGEGGPPSGGGPGPLLH